MNLINIELENILRKKSLGAELTVFSFSDGLQEVREIDNTFKSILPENLKNDFVANEMTIKIVMPKHSNKLSC